MVTPAMASTAYSGRSIARATKSHSSRPGTRRWRRLWRAPTPSSLANSGPGASHLIRALRTRLDHMPVLAIVGQQSRDALGGHYQQEVDLVSLFKDVAGAFVQQASSPAQVRHLIDRAIRIAVGDRRVTAIVLPNDLQEEPYREPARKYGTLRSGVGFAKPRVTPFEADLRRAADVLTRARRLRSWSEPGRLGRRTRSSRSRRS